MTDKNATTIRFPATANFLVDSIDRTEGETSANFLISKKNSLFNGFFTRLAVNELVLDWCVPNVAAAFNDNTFSVTVTGAGGNPYVVTLPDGFYTVKEALDALVTLLNAATGRTFSITQVGQTQYLKIDGVNTFFVNDNDSNLPLFLGLGDAVGATPANSFAIICPKLLPYTYIDFVSANLTYCQDLKDNTTNFVNRDVLYRWVFAWDNETSYDAYGFPILQGYNPFVARRYLNYPKQIKWDNIQPIGQVEFQVYGSDGELVKVTEAQGEMEWNMSILVSES